MKKGFQKKKKSFTLFLIALLCIFLASCSGMIFSSENYSTQNTDKREKYLQIFSPEEVLESSDYSIASEMDLFFLLDEKLYQFEETVVFEIESFELFENYWKTLVRQGAVHSVFVSNQIEVSYDKAVQPCMVTMRFSYNDAGHILKTYVNGSKMSFQEQRTNDLYQKVNAILAEIIKAEMTPLEKELEIHNYIIRNTVYEENVKPGSDQTTAFGVLMQGSGQCQGYAETFSLLMNLSGVPTRIVSGFVVDTNGKIAPHAWNQILLGEFWYHVDVAWNDPIPDTGDYVGMKYLNRSDLIMQQDHIWMEYFKAAPEDMLPVDIS